MVTLTKTVSLLALTLATNMITTLPIQADNSDNFTKDTVTCATVLICEKLTEFIQAQITELENSENPDFDKLDALQTQLITVENQKQENQQIVIATENQKQKENSSLIDAINKTDAQISGLRGALLEN